MELEEDLTDEELRDMIEGASRKKKADRVSKTDFLQILNKGISSSNQNIQ